MRWLYGVVMILLVSSCQSSSGIVDSPTTQQSTPVADSAQGSVEILMPANGSIIYAEALYITGTAHEIPEEGFLFQAISTQGEILAEAPVQTIAEDGNWFLEIPYQPLEEPGEVTILALAANGTIESPYTFVSVMVAPLTYRPEGTFGSIASPQEDSVIGGDQIQVIGTASGLPGNSFTLTLETGTGDEIAITHVQIDTPYTIDELVWSADLETNDYTGPAFIHAFSLDPETNTRIELGRVQVMVSAVAG